RELVLEGVAEKLGLEVTDDELREFLREQAREEDPDAVVESIWHDGRPEQLREDLLLRKALDRVVADVQRIPVELAAAREKLWTPIDDQIANLIVAQLLHLESEDPDKDISIYINSPGGDVYSGLAIYDTMQFIKPDVQTICVGIAMSMGALILAGGAKGKRMALPNAKILIHQVWTGGIGGQASDIERRANETIALKHRIEEILANHTGQD